MDIRTGERWISASRLSCHVMLQTYTVLKTLIEGSFPFSTHCWFFVLKMSQTDHVPPEPQIAVGLNCNFLGTILSMLCYCVKLQINTGMSDNKAWWTVFHLSKVLTFLSLDVSCWVHTALFSVCWTSESLKFQWRCASEDWARTKRSDVFIYLLSKEQRHLSHKTWVYFFQWFHYKGSLVLHSHWGDDEQVDLASLARLQPFLQFLRFTTVHFCVWNTATDRKLTQSLAWLYQQRLCLSYF